VSVSAAALLTTWGIQNAADALLAADAARLPYPIAAALLDQESRGANVWGHDAVEEGGVYVKGAPVTREAYLRYRALCDAGSIGAQGVGPCQLTARGYQVAADELGGCWVPRWNMQVGFQALAELMARYGEDGIRRYNGSGPAAQAYREAVQAKIALWSIILAGITRTDLTTKDVDPMTHIPLSIAGDGTFRGAANCECGASSAVVGAAWVAVTVLWGPGAGVAGDFVVTFLGASGALGQEKRQLANNERAAWSAPDGTMTATVEGRVYGQGTLPVATVISKPA
jgi:hypothetical protein